MSKSVREVEVKFFLCYLDAIMDANYILETVDIEDNGYPESLECKQLSGNFRIKSMRRSGSFNEQIYLKIS